MSLWATDEFRRVAPQCPLSDTILPQRNGPRLGRNLVDALTLAEIAYISGKPEEGELLTENHRALR